MSIEEQLYVPILKWKAGEKSALNRLQSHQRDMIIPLLEVVDYEEATGLLDGISECFGKPVYIDTSIVDVDNREYLLSLSQAASTMNVEIYPVIAAEDFPEVADTIAASVKRIAIRLPFPEPLGGIAYKELFQAISAWTRPVPFLDIIFDLDHIESRQKASVLLLELKNTLRSYIMGNTNVESVILAMTTFPTVLNDIEAGSDVAFDRYELEIFNSIIEQDEFKSIKDKLVFSDYGVTRFTESEIDFSKLKYGILPKARYTFENKYWVLKGQKDSRTRDFIRSSRDIANALYSAPFYYGEEFSFGDFDIKERAIGNKGPGNSKDWVTIAANHHIVVVLSELSNLRDS